MKARLSVAAGAAVGALLLWLAFRDVHPLEVLAGIKAFDPRWAPLLFTLPVADLWLRAMRWKILLRPVAQAPVFKLLQLESVGLALNNLVFMRLGELARAVVVGLELDAHAVAVLATIIVERLCDTAALLTLVTAGIWLAGLRVEPALHAALAAAAAGVWLAVWAAALCEKWLARLARERLAPWPRLAHLAEDLASGTRGLLAPGAWWRVGALSLGLWMCDAAVFWTAARALGLEPALSYGRSVAVVAVGAGATAIPAVPGGFGNFEAAVKWVLMRFGTAPREALTFAAFTHLVMYSVVTLIGIVSMYRLGHSLENLKAAVERLRHARRPREAR